LAWSQETLAEKSGVSLPTIQRFEAKDGELGGREDTREKIRAALEQAQIEFTNGEEPGVRLLQAGRTGKGEGALIPWRRKPAWESQAVTHALIRPSVLDCQTPLKTHMPFFSE